MVSINGEEGTSNSWDRGFKLANLPIKEGVPYRVSMWIKGPEGVEGKLSSWLSVGIENFDKSFTTADGKNYGLDQITLNGDGEWQRISFLSVYHGKEAIKTVIDGQSWVGNAVWPEQFEGADGTTSYKDHFGGYIPETFFFIANMNTAGEYMLDDICIEENASIAGASFNEECVKIDFGFPTNIADLAKASNGLLNLPTSWVTVKQGNTTYEVEFLEGHSDGYLYAFLPDGVNFDTESEDPVIITFTPSDDCPIEYTTQQRPGEATVVLSFENEAAYYDGNIDAFSQAWSAPEFVSVSLENNSFNLSSNDVSEIVLQFNKEISLDIASATWSYSDNFGSHETDLSNNMTVGEDGTSLIITLPAEIEDNQYKLTINGVANIMGMEMENDIELTYEFGNDTEATEVQVMYKSDFNSDETDAVPQGWNTYNEAGYHLYGFNDDGSRMKYGYGANPGGGGTRLFDGFSGDFTKALYWGTRGTNEGYASFGELITDYMNPDGTVDEASLPDGVSKEDISLYLTPQKYNVSFKMAAWKGEPKFDFTLEDLDGNVVAEFTGYTAKPNLNGNKGKVSGVLSLEADFTVETEGYYVMKFVSQEAQWQEFMLADVQVITMPSKAAYYNGLIADAAEKAEETLYEAYDLEDSDTWNALDEEIQVAKSIVYHSPSEVMAEIAKLEELSAALLARQANIDDYDSNIDAVKEGVAALEGKYLNVDVVTEANEIIAKYGDKTGAQLSDEELAAAAPVVKGAAEKLAHVKECTDLLTWGIYKALQTAEVLGAEDAEAIEAGQNAISDDREVAAAINKANKIALYKKIVAGEWNDPKYAAEPVAVYEMKLGNYETADGLVEDWMNVEGDSVKGIELTGYVANPKMYRVNGVDGLPGWNVGPGSEDQTASSVAGGTAPSAAQHVTDGRVETFGKVNYDVNQTIEGMPAGKYIVTINARTPLVDRLTNAEDQYYNGRMYYYNAQEEESGIWDMFLYAGNEANTAVVPMNGGNSNMSNTNTAIREVTVGEDGIMTIGVHQNYVSGVAEHHESHESTDGWQGTVYADDVHIYFVAPLEGFDYSNALTDAIQTINSDSKATIVDIYNMSGVRVAKAQKGVNIVKMSNGKVVKVLVK